ncbi:MAG: hypothetical protein AAF500_20780 [Myxococcota bacterium]
MRALAWCLLLVTLACSGSGDGTGGPENDGPAGQDAFRGFAFNAIVNQPQGQVSFVHLVTSLGAEVEVDVADALEASGGAHIHGGHGTGAVFLSSAEAPRVTRYDITSDRRFVERETIQFAGSTTEAAPSVYIASPTKGYYFDEGALRFRIFDPTAMVLLGEIDVSEAAPREGFQAAFGNPIRRGNELVVTVAAIDRERFPVVQAAAVILDLETDEVSITRDDRCGYMFDGVVAPSGDLYLTSATYYAIHNAFFPDDFPPACMLRIPAGQRAFDPDYFVDLNTVSDGLPSGGVAAGSGSRVYLKAFDESTVSPDALVAPFFALGINAWRLWSLDLETLESAPVDAFGLSSGGLGYAQVGDLRFLGSTATDFSQTTLFDADTLEEAISFPGFPTEVIALP